MHPLTVHELARLKLAELRLAEQLDHARRSSYRAPARPRQPVGARLSAWFASARGGRELRPTAALRRGAA